ncbi:hypothetical protein ACHAXM_010622 [Skeletonema potamos]|jgi:Leucine-rich repeat (LRR) protein
MVRSVGGSSGYSFTASGASSSSGDDYYDDDHLDKSPRAYFEYAAAAVGSHSPSARNGAGGTTTPPPRSENDLTDILVPTSYSPVRKHYNGHEVGISPLESNSGELSAPPREFSPRYQEYYDVLELANNRLKKTTQPPARLNSDGAVILEEEHVEKKKKSKKKKKKDKKEKRKKRHEDEETEDVDIDGRRRISVFQTVFQPTLVQAHSSGRKSFTSEAEIRSALEISKRRGNHFADEENAPDPNDEVPPPPTGPISWSPAALVNASRSKQSGAKIDQQGFYAPVGGSTSTKRKPAGFGSWVQNLMQSRSDKELPKDYNLNSIGRSDSVAIESQSLSSSRASSASTSKPEKKKRSKYKTLSRHDSIDWGDESALGDHEEESVVSREQKSEIEMKVADSCSFSEINESNENWNANTDYVEKLVWYRDRRRLGIVVTLVVLFLAGCSALYFSGGYKKMAEQSKGDTFESTIEENVPDSDHHIKDDYPIYPLPPPPMIDHSVLQGGFNGTSLKPLSSDDVKNIIGKITPDANILTNPDTPQAKAMAWSLEDRTKYNVEVPVRIGVRYALATLYYATNGDKWLNNTNWKTGHECLWNGVYCELDANNIVSVTYLNLVTNNLDGSIPEEIGYIESLQRIEFGSNKLVGPIPQSFASLYDLRTLSVSDNQLTGEIGTNIDGMTKLTNLDLADNRFRGHVPHGLGGIPTLSYVRLSNNRFTGAFPTSFISLNNLHTLLIDNNAIGGTIPALIGMMKTLVNLRLHKNDFYGDLPNFSDAILLETVHLDDNFFKGLLPQFGSQRLRELYFDKNSLTGPIPTSYGNHPKLQVLSARNNALSSTIPASLASATNLGVLDLSYNKLSGELDENLSQLTQMKQIYLNNNRLQGSFPKWLGSMKNLEIAHFNNNLFSGNLQLGVEFENLDDLAEFTIENNQLVGMMPEDVCDLLLDVLTADCWGNPAAVECPCCTKCYGAR